MRDNDDARRDALCELIRLYQTDVLRMCHMFLRDRHQAEDATQETFLKAYLSYDTLRDREKPKAWLMAIALNACRAMLRSRWTKHIARSAPDFVEKAGAQPFSADEIMLHIEVERLPYRQREIVLLYYYQGLNVDEIAGCLRISRSTVSYRLKRARKRLKDALRGDERHE